MGDSTRSESITWLSFNWEKANSITREFKNGFEHYMLQREKGAEWRI